MLAFSSNSQCSESSHLNKSILMREATVFQTSYTRLKETEFLQSLEATTNIAACLGKILLPLCFCIGQQHNTTRSKHIHCPGLTSSISFGYDGITQGHQESLLKRHWQIVRSQFNLPHFYYAKQMLILRRDVAINNADVPSASARVRLPCIAGGGTGYKLWDRDNTRVRGPGSVISFQSHLSYLRPLTLDSVLSAWTLHCDQTHGL